MASHSGPDIIEDGLVLALDAANTKSYPSSGGSTWYDVSGKKNDCGISGATYNSDGYFDFDGSNDYVNRLNTSLVSNGGGTLECWFNSDDLSSDGTFINHSGFMYWNLIVRGYDDKIRLEYKSTSSNNTQLLSSSTISNGNWYHVVGVVNDTGARIYINGELDSSNSTPQNLGTVSSHIYIGHYGTGSYEFDGKIAVVKRYNKPLTAAEVKQNFNALRGRYGI